MREQVEVYLRDMYGVTPECLWKDSDAAAIRHHADKKWFGIIMPGIAWKKLGADRVVIPEKENASRLARSLSSPNVLDYIELSDDYGIVEVPAPVTWHEKTIKDLNVRAKLGVNILAVRRDGKINVSPAADFVIRSGDIMVVLGDTFALEAVQKL